jgi:hypothetical protein
VYQELAAERCPEDLGVGEHRKDDVIQGLTHRRVDNPKGR